MENLINLTPHKIVETTTGATYAPSGQVARVAVEYRQTGELAGAPVSVAEYGEIQGLPAPAADTVYIVSGMVLAATSRRDVVAPGELVRDADGKPVGCRGWKGVA